MGLLGVIQVLNVKLLGAKGDGTTDDRAAIQSALTLAAALNNGFTVYFPPGRYLVSSAGTKTDGGGSTYNYCLAVSSNTVVECADGAVIQLMANQQAAIFTNANSNLNGTDTGIVFKNVKLDGNFAGQNHTVYTEQGCIFMWGLADSKFLNLHVVNAHQYFGRWLSCTNCEWDQLWGKSSYGSGWHWGISGGQEVTYSKVGTATSIGTQGLLTPDMVNGAVGNPFIMCMQHCSLGELHGDTFNFGCKFQDTSSDCTLSSFIGNNGQLHGFKLEAGSGSPTRIHVGQVSVTNTAGAGLYMQGCVDCVVDSYVGDSNGTVGGGGYPDVWLAGTDSRVGYIRSTGSKNAAIVIRSDAVNYQIGDVYVQNPNGDVFNVNDATNGSIGFITAIDSRGGGAQMAAIFRVNSATSKIRCLGWVGSGYTAGPLIFNVSYTTGYLNFAHVGTLLNVRNFGAKGDGVTDDTAAFQAALNQASLVAGSVYVPTGHYIVSSTVGAGADGVRIFGDGWGTNIDGNLSGTAVITCVHNHLVVQDLRLTAVCRTGVVAQATNVIIRDCFITNCTQLGSDAGFTGAIIFQDSSDCWAIRNTCWGNGAVQGTVGGANWGYGQDIGTYSGSVANNRLYFLDNDCSSIAVHGNIVVFNGKQGIISRNRCTGAVLNSDGTSGGYGIVIYNAGDSTYGDDWVVCNNNVHDTYGSGIYVQGNKNSVIADNYVKNPCLHQIPGTLLVAGIACNLGPSTIVGNVIETSHNDGISIEGNYHAVGPNAIYSPAAAGFQMQGPVSNSTVDGLIIFSPGGVGIANSDWIGNALESPSYQNTISNCTVFGNGLTGNIAGFGFANMFDSTLHGNKAYQMGSVGYELRYCNEIDFHHNRAQDCVTSGLANAGIQITDSRHIKVHYNVSGNVFGGTQTAGLQEANIVTQTPPDFNYYFHNDFSHNLGNGLLLLGAHNKVRYNQVEPSFAHGSATLVAGTVTVANASVAAHDQILPTRSTLIGTPGVLTWTINPGVGFTVTSINISTGLTQTLDLSVFAYQIVHSAPIPIPATDAVNVADYGAKGDSSSNDTSAFAQAIADLPFGGVVYVGKGTFKANVSIVQGNITVRGDVPMLFGDSQIVGSKIVPWDATLPAIAVGNGTAAVDHVILRDLYVVGDSSTSNSDGVVVNGVEHVYMEGLNVGNFGRHCINITSSLTQLSAHIFMTRMGIVNYGMAGAGSGLNIDYGGSFVGDPKISNSFFTGAAGVGPNVHSISVNDFVALFVNDVWIDCPGADPATDPLGQSGSVYLTGTASNGTHIFANNLTIDSPPGGSVDELVVVNSSFGRGINSWISGLWTCDGVVKFLTDSSWQDKRNTFGGLGAWYFDTNKELANNAVPSSGPNGENIWTVGDRIWNTAPVAGGSMGWVCTTSGAFAANGAWMPLTNYSRGDASTTPQSVSNFGNVYQCIKSGSSGNAGGPSGTGTDIVDPGGTAHWRFIGVTPPVFKEFGLISL